MTGALIIAWIIASLLVFIALYFFVVPWIKIQVALIRLWFIGRKLKKSDNPVVRMLGKTVLDYVKKERKNE